MSESVLPRSRAPRKFRAIACMAAGVILSCTLWPVASRAEPPACSVLSLAQVSSILNDKVSPGVAVTRSNPEAAGAIGHVCAYVGQSRSAVLGFYHGSSAQLARIKQVNENTGSVTAMKGDMLVSAYVSDTPGGAPKPNRESAEKLLDAALSKL